VKENGYCIYIARGRGVAKGGGGRLQKRRRRGGGKGCVDNLYNFLSHV